MPVQTVLAATLVKPGRYELREYRLPDPEPAGVTTTHSTNRGDSFTVPNVLGAAIPGDDREWIDATGSNLIYMNYHDVGTFNIEVQRSNDGGETYVNGFGEAIDAQTFPQAGNLTPTSTANIAGRIQVDRSSCPSRGSLYQIFVAPDNASENTGGMPMRSVYVGVSSDVKCGSARIHVYRSQGVHQPCWVAGSRQRNGQHLSRTGR